MYFCFLLFILASCIPFLWPFIYIHCTLFSYIWWWCMFFFFSSPISTCVVPFLSLYTCFFMYAIFIFVSHMIPWWVLLKCFRKKDYESISCHELSSCKVFQVFVVGIDLFINTSGYEFSDLRLLSWLFFLLCFCHSLPKREIVRKIFYVIG